MMTLLSAASVFRSFFGSARSDAFTTLFFRHRYEEKGGWTAPVDDFAFELDDHWDSIPSLLYAGRRLLILSQLRHKRLTKRIDVAVEVKSECVLG